MSEIEVAKPEEVVVLKVGTCESLSGRSILSYQVGYRGKSGEHVSKIRPGVLFRISENSGKGLFHDGWISLPELDAVFDKADTGLAITSASLHAVFAGKSINTAGFLLAVLKAEGLVKQTEEKKRSYVCTGLEGFLNEILELTRLAVPLENDNKEELSMRSERKGKGKS